MKDYLVDKNDNIIHVGEYFCHISGPMHTSHKGVLKYISNELIIEWDDGIISKYTDMVFYDQPEWSKHLIEKCI